jgi:hypothetical protein
MRKFLPGQARSYQHTLNIVALHLLQNALEDGLHPQPERLLLVERYRRGDEHPGRTDILTRSRSRVIP